MVGSRDLCLGEIHGYRFYMASDQFEYYKNSHILVDVSESESRGSSFSLEIPLGLRFMAVSRLFTEDEMHNIRPVN